MRFGEVRHELDGTAHVADEHGALESERVHEAEEVLSLAGHVISPGDVLRLSSAAPIHG